MAKKEVEVSNNPAVDVLKDMVFGMGSSAEVAHAKNLERVMKYGNQQYRRGIREGGRIRRRTAQAVQAGLGDALTDLAEKKIVDMDEIRSRMTSMVEHGGTPAHAVEAEIPRRFKNQEKCRAVAEVTYELGIKEGIRRSRLDGTRN